MSSPNQARCGGKRAGLWVHGFGLGILTAMIPTARMNACPPTSVFHKLRVQDCAQHHGLSEPRSLSCCECTVPRHPPPPHSIFHFIRPLLVAPLQMCTRMHMKCSLLLSVPLLSPLLFTDAVVPLRHHCRTTPWYPELGPQSHLCRSQEPALCCSAVPSEEQ